MSDTRERELLEKALVWIEEELKNIGGCDHSVGICQCGDEALADELFAYLYGKCRQCGNPTEEETEYCHGAYDSKTFSALT